VSLDDVGYVWLIGNDNHIYHELPTPGWVQFSPPIPNSCVQKLAISGRADVNPRILALACSGAIYRYLDGIWILQRSSGGVDVSVTSGGTLTYVTTANSLSYTGTGGGGVIVTLGSNTQVTETFTGGSVVHTTTLLAGFTGAFGNDFFACHGGLNGIVGSAAFYSFAS